MMMRLLDLKKPYWRFRNSRPKYGCTIMRNLEMRDLMPWESRRNREYWNRRAVMESKPEPERAASNASGLSHHGHWHGVIQAGNITT